MVNAVDWSIDGIGSVKFFRNATGNGVAGYYYAADSIYGSKYPTDEALRSALIYANSGGAYAGARDWVQDINMMKWARAVMDYYSRDIPGRSDGGKWADRSDLFFFDAAVKYFKKFEYRYAYNQSDCEMLKEMGPAIDAEHTNVLAERAAGAFGTGEEGHYLRILGDLQQKVNTAQAELTCDQYLTDQQNNQILNTQFQQIQQAQTLTKPDNKTTYLVYGMIGAVLLVTGILLMKK
jgi:hypothetical protein